jgi:hypothetical protein
MFSLPVVEPLGILLRTNTKSQVISDTINAYNPDIQRVMCVLLYYMMEHFPCTYWCKLLVEQELLTLPFIVGFVLLDL